MGEPAERALTPTSILTLILTPTLTPTLTLTLGSGLLAVYLGTGVQLLGMGVITMCFALFGFLSPSNRGGLMTALLVLFVCMGGLAGYVSAVFYKTFKGVQWKMNTLKTVARTCPHA